MNNKRLNSRKRHIAPAVIGAGISTIGNLAGVLGANSRAKAEQEALLSQMWNNKELMDSNILKEYDTTGQDGLQYYANGGRINKPIRSSYSTTGGDLIPIANGVEEVVGNTHGENTIDGSYGVTLNQNGTDVAEVEDGEVIVDDKVVFSDRLMYDNKNSFADKMKQISGKRNKLETKLDKKSSTRLRNGVERKLAGLNMAEDVLYTEQEQAKLEEGKAELGMLATGGVIPDLEELLNENLDNDLINKRGLIGRTTPLVNNTTSLPSTSADSSDDFLSGNTAMFLDNAANALINLQSPRVPKPILNAAPRINTRVNVSPQIASINNAIGSIEDNVLGNTSNSSIARSNIASARLRGAEAASNIYAQKENMENSLENRQTELNYNNTVNNNQLLNNSAMMQANNRAGRLARTSANVSNLSDDFTRIAERRDMDRYYDEDLLNNLLDDKTGEKKRTARKSPYINKRLTRAGLNNLLNS